MYAEQWSPRLRQGDVFGEIMYPLSKKAGVQRLSAETSLAVNVGTAATTQTVVPVTTRYAMVISHDCEFNPGKRDHFLVARVQNVPHDVESDPGKFAELLAGNDYAARAKEGNPVAIDNFVLDPLAGCFEKHFVVNFATIVPLPMGTQQDMLRLKRAELDHDQRVLLRNKLAGFIGRGTDDVPADYKIERPEDPSDLEWVDVPVPEEDLPASSVRL